MCHAMVEKGFVSFLAKLMQPIVMPSIATFLVALLFGGTNTAYAGVDANAMVRAADQARFPPGSVSFVVRVEDFAKGKKTRETEYRVMTEGARKSLVETTQPERQQGRKLLMVENDLWFFSPNIRKPARVSLQQKLTGEISNGDLSNTNYAGDYEAKFVASETIDGKRLAKLHLKAVAKSATYAAIDYWIEESTNTPFKVHFMTASGRIMKRGIFEKFGPVLGRNRMVRFKVEDAIAKDRSSVLYYSGYKKESFAASVFSKESMSP